MAGSTSEQHWETDACTAVHCCYHHVDEPPPEGGAYFQVCFECKHGYMTEQELVDTFNAVMRQMNEDAEKNGWTPIEFVPVDDADQIFFCPLCSHDW
jgi:hypothetical protein